MMIERADKVISKLREDRQAFIEMARELKDKLLECQKDMGLLQEENKNLRASFASFTSGKNPLPPEVTDSMAKSIAEQIEGER